MNRHRRAYALLLVLVCVGCGATAPVTARHVPDGEVRAALAPVDTTLPLDAPLYATARAAELTPLFGVFLSMFDAERLPDVVARLALDPARASSAALYPCDASLGAIAERAAALVPIAPDAAPTADMFAAVAAVLEPARDAAVHARFVIASTRPESTVEVLGAVLREAGLTRASRTPRGFDAVYRGSGHVVVALLHDAQNVVVEVLDFPFAATAPRDRDTAELERIRGGSRRTNAPAQALADGELGRIVGLPDALATLHFLRNVGLVWHAVMGADANSRNALLSYGLFESGAGLALAREARGVYAERIEMTAQGTLATLETTVRIALGPGLVGAIPASAPAQGTTISPMEFGYIEASSAARAVPLPHRANEEATPNAYQHLLSEAGGAPYLYVLPHMIVLMIRELLDEDSEVPIPSPIRASADRIGAMFGDHDRVRVALLPANASAVDAALAIPHAIGARRPRLLSIGDLTTIGEVSAMATSVGDRFAVILSANPAMLRAAHLELTPASTAVATATISLAAFPRVFGLSRLGLPAGYHFALEVTPTEWVLRGTPGAEPTSPAAAPAAP